MNAFDTLYENLLDGVKYGERLANVSYPCFWWTLFYNGKNFVWRHYGQSANPATKEDLHFILNTIFGMTAEQFCKKYMTYEYYFINFPEDFI